ncbi:unnamed protein product [Tetraodon nigroviridis]|uniref:(spotted green pufferfish) hypothetical protein n=1 Tax=Tetraodon nigroviridis TaxID=99883 RepID=Q4RHJ0_TETNG|nr:unnamed protein product [Tetraodon nigroviridis]
MGDSKLCSPVQEQVGTLRRSSDRKSPAQTSQEKRAVFTLFRKLEAMGENPGRTPPELGNYFSPPSKDKYMEFKKKEAPESSQAGSVTNSGAAERLQNWENVYAEPGAPPINPVPKPQRTFQHPSFERSQRKGRGQRNLPPLPNISAKPPSGVFLRPRDSSNENPYEDIELESQCSQQSLPSSPGADSTKVAAGHTRHRPDTGSP